MRILLIPVKDRSQAKQRLAPWLSSEERAALASAMLEDTFAAASAVRGIDGVFVVTASEPVLRRARDLGWDVVPETMQHGESRSVDSAVRFCAERGATTVLRLPIDLPLVEAADIESVFAMACPAPSMVIVPSRDGTGTNALLRTPPSLFPSHFGPHSFSKHLHEARACGATVRILENPRLAMDLDDAEDLRALLSACPLVNFPDRATGRWLAGSATIRRLLQESSGATP